MFLDPALKLYFLISQNYLKNWLHKVRVFFIEFKNRSRKVHHRPMRNNRKRRIFWGRPALGLVRALVHHEARWGGLKDLARGNTET